MIYHYTPIRLAKIWNTDNTKCCPGCSKTTLYDTITVDICHCTFVQTHRMYTTRSEP